MTDSECIVRVIDAHKAARRRLACLEQRKEDYAAAYRAFADVFAGRKEGRIASDGEGGARLEVGPRRGIPAVVVLPSADEAAEVLAGIDSARERVQKLTERRRELGID